jgi:large subunit ribosomal protein L12
MEYVYSAMLLHKAGKDITEDAVKAVLSAAGVTADDARVKALVAALQGVNIEEAIAKAAAPVAVAAAPVSDAAPAEAKKEENKEDTKKAEESAAAGLGALFG